MAIEWSGHGPAFIFAHGLTGNRLQSQRLVSSLHNAFQVVTFDQRGHGESTPVTRASDYDAGQMAADIVAVMGALGIERAAIGGSSMGSATALVCALHNPNRVSRLVLVAPAFGDRPNPSVGVLQEAGREIADHGLQAYIDRCRQLDWPAAGMTEEAMAFRTAMLRSHDRASISLACNTVAKWVLFPDLSALAALAIPTQIIAWEGDLVHPWQLAQRLAGAIPGASLLRASAKDYHNEAGFVAGLCRDFLTAG